jgi:hypothetical protein
MDRCELLSPTVPLLAQPTGQGTNALVPTLVSFSGKLTDVDGRPPMGIVGVTFYLYKDAEGSTPLMDGDTECHAGQGRTLCGYAGSKHECWTAD